MSASSSISSSLGQVGRSQIEGIVEALVDSAADKSEATRQAVVKALVDIGRKKHATVLGICHSYLKKHSKLPRSHRIVLLQLLEKVCKEHIHSLEEPLANDLIELASTELTKDPDVVPEWQGAASVLLTTLGVSHAPAVLQELLKRFQPGTTPHYFVVKTTGDLAMANVVEVVPQLNAVLSRMITQLGAIKHENMQWVFSYALARFSEAILDYMADEQRVSSGQMTFSQFEGHIFSSFDQLFNVWLMSKESRLRMAVAEALGFMVHLLSATALNDQLPKLLPGIMQLYKKHSEHYYISQCLCMVVDAAGKKSCNNLELQLNNLLTILFHHACVPVDSTSFTSIKNHNEILRCFAVTGLIYSNQAVGFLLQKLEVAQEKVRVPTLEVLKHIINSCDEVMADKKSLVVSGLKIVLNEQSLRVRRILCQVIIAMAHHDYLSLEGGQLMVEFVVRQCSLNTEDKTLQKLNTTEVTIKGLRDMSDNVLLLVTTTIEHMKEVLWPYLLEFIVPVQYTGAVGIVSRCIADIGKGKREEEADDYDLNFDELANIPRQPELIARLIVLAGHPHNGQGRGEHILNCMTALVPNLHEDLVDLWDAVIPKLLSYLNEQSEKGTWDQKHWEDLMLKFVSRSLDDVKNEEWLIEVGLAMGEKERVLERYMNYPEEKGFLFKCLGVIMRKVSQRQFIQKMLDSMFSTIKHSNQAEREGCAIGVGFCAASHLDLAVSKLEQVIKEEMVRKSKGFFGFSKDKSEADVERIKATVLLCYGYVTFHSPPNLIMSRVEVNILRSINPHFNKIRDTVVKQNLIRTIDLMGRALHPDHLKKDDFIFSKRGDLLNHLLDYIHGEPVAAPITTETRALAINALTTLVKLDPQLSEAEQFDVIKAATDSVFPLPVMTSPSKKDSVTVEESILLLEGALSSVTSLLIVVLSKQFSSGNLYSIFKHLSPWIQSSDDQERNRGVLCFLDLMKGYQLNSDTDETSREMEIQGELLGRMVPRCTDPSLDTRLAAIDCVQMILRVSTCDPGVPDQMVDAVTLLRDRAESDEANILYSLVNDLSKVFCKKVADRNLWPLMTFLLEGLVDSQAHSSSAACVVLNNIVKLRGGSLGEQIPDLVDGLHEKLDGIYTPQTRTGTLRCMRTICSQYLLPTISHLLDKPLPWDKNLVAMWHIIAGEAHLLKSVFLNLLEVLSLSLPYQEKAKGQGKVSIVETTLPKAASNAVGVLCETEEAQEVAKEMFAQIFSSLILRIGVSVVIESTKKPLCVSVAIDSLKQFLKATGSEDILDRLESNGVWPLMEKEDTCPHSMLHLARYKLPVPILLCIICFHT
jgi:hypothetical protein